MARQVNWNEVNLDVGWGVLRGKRCIVGDALSTTPVLRLLGLHGWLDNANTFDRLVPLLPSATEVFLLDLPGHGLSDHLPDGSHYSTMTYAISVRRVVLELGWKSFAFLGHSMGCYIAGYYISMFPSEVIAAIFIDYLNTRKLLNPLQVWCSDIDLILRCEKNEKPSGMYSEEDLLNRMVRSRMGGPNKDILNIDKDSARVLLPRAARMERGGLMWRHDQKTVAHFSGLYGNDNWLHVLSKVKCPVLLFHAIDGIYTLPASEYKCILDTYKTNAEIFKYVLVEGTHHVHLTHPLRIAPMLAEFLSESVIPLKLTSSKL